MQINRTAWHYRLIKFWNSGRAPDNLCAYMRRLVASLIISVIMTVFMGGMAWAGLNCMVWQPIMWAWGLFDPSVVIADYNYLFVGLFIWALVGIGCLGVVVENRGWLHRTKPRKPSLIVEYIKAKHQKVCKGIDFV